MIPEYDNLVPYFKAICDPHCFAKKVNDMHCPYWTVCKSEAKGETMEERNYNFEMAILKRYHEIHG